MVKKKMSVKKLLAILLTLVIFMSVLPIGMLSNVYAANTCFAVNIDGKKVYFYGADSLVVDGNKVTFEGGDGASKVYVGGAEDTGATVTTDTGSVEFNSTWLTGQTDWIAYQCDSNSSVPTTEPSVDVDTTAPTVTGVTGNPTDWTKGPITLTVAGDDGTTGTGVAEYSKDGTTWQDSGAFNITANGTYTFYVRDNVGNVSAASTSIKVDKIDDIAPTISAVAVKNWTSSSADMVVEASDDQSGIFRYKMDGGEWQESNEFPVTGTASHTFYVKDKVGNEASTTQDINDNVAPTVTSVTAKYDSTYVVAENSWTSDDKDYVFTVTGDDDKSGVYQYSSDGTTWQTDNTFTLKGGQDHTFYVQDGAGNNSAGKTFQLQKDVEGPVIDSVTPDKTEDTSDPITITVAASDSEAGLNASAYSIDEGAWQSSNTFVIKDSKKHIISVRDNAIPANVRTIDDFQATNFNDGKPTITGVTSSNENWTNDSITLTVSADPSQNNAGTTFAVVKYKMDTDAWQTSNEFDVDNCYDHTFYVIDNCGKISDSFTMKVGNYDSNSPVLAAGKAVTFTQDNSGVLPTVLNKLSFGRFFNSKLVIKVNAKDPIDATINGTKSNASGIVKGTFVFVDNKDNVYTFDAKPVGNATDAELTFDVKGEDLPEDFEGKAKVILCDAAGNESTIDITTANSDMGDIPTDSDFYFMVENVAPTVDSITPASTVVTDVYKNDYSVEFKVSDTDQVAKNSGLAKVQIKVNDTVVVDDDYQSEAAKKSDATFNLTTDAVNKTVNGVSIANWNKGELKYEIAVVDNAGNQTNDTRTYKFDQTAPQITGFEFSQADLGYYKDEPKFEGVFESVSIEDYGFYFKNTVSVKVSAKDKKNTDEAIATGLKSITVYLKDVDGTIYIVNSNNSQIVKSANNSISDAVAVNTTDSISFVIPKDFKGQIYAYATDNVNNSPQDCRYALDKNINADGFVHPDASIVESETNHAETSAIEFVNVPKAAGTQNNKSSYNYEGKAQKDKVMDYDVNANVPLYSGDTSFDVKVSDTYSGIREVKYTLIEGEEKTSNTAKLTNEGKFDGDSQGWAITKNDGKLVAEMTNTIAVSGNYNDMVLLIELTDRAGNKSYDYYMFGIDKTTPSITVTYDNNKSDKQSGTGDYFKENRTATILVQERNFNTENVVFTVKNAEGTAPKVVDKKLVVKDKEGNGDGNIYKYVIKYTADGVYSFNVKYSDRALNKATVDYKDSVAPKKFVLDKTKPTINVMYDNNDSQNDKFFKENRKATITIKEHNFDVNRVAIALTSSISGNAIDNPSVSWVNDGDTHVATINYNVDGDYTFDIKMTDKANNNETDVNYGSSVAAKEFTVDTTYNDLVKVDGIKDKGVLGLVDGDINSDAKVSIKVNDVNLDNYNVKLTRSRVLVSGESDDAQKETQKDVIANPDKQCAENNVDVTSKFVKKSSGSENSTATISIPKKTDGVKNDGLYTLTIAAKDKAGNTYDTKANVITFSVNRFGSVFTFSQALYDLINVNDGYTQNVSSKDLTVYEYNATSVHDEKVEVIANNDSKILTKKSNYTVAEDSKQDETSWSKYTYRIKADNFSDDGVYTLRVSSKDAASITSQTVDYDICDATFRVDSTPADISSVNYSTDVKKMSFSDAGSAKTDALKVSFSVEDLIRLETVKVYVNDKLQKTYTYGKDFDDANSFSGGEFVINDGGSSEQSFKIVVTDKAGNTIDTSNEKKYKPGYVFFDHIVVTSSAFAQFYANKALFFGSLAGVVLIAAFLFFIIFKRKKKKDDDEEKA